MNIYVMNSALERIGVIDGYRSIIWTTRYYKPGDFELYIDATPDNISLCQSGRFLYRDKGYENGVIKSVMIIQAMQVHTSLEEGNTILLSGKDLKFLLHQRVIWKQTVFSGTVEDNVRRAVTENIISPTIADRAISNFALGDTLVGTETVKAQAYGENLGEWISEQLMTYELGYDVTLNNGNFVFTVYKGSDRSFAQSDNPYVIFSPDYENLLSTDYTADMTEYKNVALVKGEGEGTAKKTATAGTGSGIDRFEITVDGGSLSSDSDGGTIPAGDYTAQLKAKGEDELTQHPLLKAFAGEVQSEVNFVYGTDYFLGDKVETLNEFGIQASARIIEIIDSEDETGHTLIPTFSDGGV